MTAWINFVLHSSCITKRLGWIAAPAVWEILVAFKDASNKSSHCPFQASICCYSKASLNLLSCQKLFYESLLKLLVDRNCSSWYKHQYGSGKIQKGTIYNTRPHLFLHISVQHTSICIRVLLFTISMLLVPAFYTTLSDPGTFTFLS